MGGQTTKAKRQRQNETESKRQTDSEPSRVCVVGAPNSKNLRKLAKCLRMCCCMNTPARAVDA